MEPEQSSETELSGPLPLAIPAGAEESVVAKQELRKLEAEDVDKAEWRVPAELVVEVRSALLIGRSQYISYGNLPASASLTRRLKAVLPPHRVGLYKVGKNITSSLLSTSSCASPQRSPSKQHAKKLHWKSSRPRHNSKDFGIGRGSF